MSIEFLCTGCGDQAGIQPEKAQHAHYGTVNSYPEWIWQLAADGMGGAE